MAEESESSGIIIFTLWYVFIGINYLIVPLFEGFGKRCKCGRSTCCAGSESNTSLSIGQETNENPYEEGKQNPDDLIEEAEAMAEEIQSIKDQAVNEGSEETDNDGLQEAVNEEEANETNETIPNEDGEGDVNDVPEPESIPLENNNVTINLSVSNSRNN